MLLQLHLHAHLDWEHNQHHQTLDSHSGIKSTLYTHLIKLCVQWGQVTEADPELLSKHIKMFQGILVSLVTFSDAGEGFVKGCD